MSEYRRKIKVVSDRGTWDTKVVDAETGQLLPASKAVITLRAGELPSIELELLDVELDLVGYSIKEPQTSALRRQITMLQCFVNELLARNEQLTLALAEERRQKGGA